MFLSLYVIKIISRYGEKSHFRLIFAENDLKLFLFKPIISHFCANCNIFFARAQYFLAKYEIGFPDPRQVRVTNLIIL